MHRTGAFRQILDRYANSKIVVAACRSVFSEVGSNQGPSKPFIELDFVGYSRTILIPVLASGADQAGAASIKDMNRTSTENAVHLFPSHTDGQVGESITVEVSRGKRGSKIVSAFGHIGNAGAVLAPELTVI